MSIVPTTQQVTVLGGCKDSLDAVAKLARVGWTCTASADKKHTSLQAIEFVCSLIRRGHLSILEHHSITMELVTSRAIANQLVRYRLGSYAQESMRYVRYDNKDYRFIVPDDDLQKWEENPAKDKITSSIESSINHYKDLMSSGLKAEVARDVLPLCSATRLVVTWNLRQLAHILYDPYNGRLHNKHAQPLCRKLAAKIEAAVLDAGGTHMGIILDEFKKFYSRPASCVKSQS